MERQERRRSTDFSVPGVVFVCLFIAVVLAFACSLTYLVLFSFMGGTAGKRGEI